MGAKMGAPQIMDVVFMLNNDPDPTAASSWLQEMAASAGMKAGCQRRKSQMIN